MEENSEFYICFMLTNNNIDSTTKIEKTFDAWAETEFATIVEELRYCLMACGYSEGLVSKYIPSPVD